VSDWTAVRIDDVETMFLGGMRRVRSALGVTSFGIQVLELPPNLEAYPEHDHTHDGQEEVYLLLEGGGEVELDGERRPLVKDELLRVGPSVKRKIWPGPEGARLLALGGVPGKPYEVRRFTELGEPDPMAG
jgi:mannose-6-phosphate isomerase-like protein (cupin superfamily)